jgi:DNA-binding NarL/FixJ family response regulator
MADPVRIAVVDDHPLFREGVASTLRFVDDFDVVGVGASGADGIRIADEAKPDIMILDISMPGGGIETAHAIVQMHPSIKAIVLTVSEQESDVLAAMAAGVRGYVLKGITGADLVTTVRSVAQGEIYITPQFAARLLNEMRTGTARNNPKEPEDSLTHREAEILHEVSAGLTNKEIAQKLELKEKTVKHYMTNVLQKLRVRNRVEAAMAHLHHRD